MHPSLAMPGGIFDCLGTWWGQEGEMRLAREWPWLRFAAEQWFPGSAIDFRWQARVPFSERRKETSPRERRTRRQEHHASRTGAPPLHRSEASQDDRSQDGRHHRAYAAARRRHLTLTASSTLRDAGGRVYQA
jgi:hypothetical protein